MARARGSVKGRWDHGRRRHHLPVELRDQSAVQGDEVTALPSGLAAPARRALVGAGIVTLEDVARFPRAKLVALHGMGPKALRVLDEALTAAGLTDSAMNDR
jgi:hypothetical protein